MLQNLHPSSLFGDLLGELWRPIYNTFTPLGPMLQNFHTSILFVTTFADILGELWTPIYNTFTSFVTYEWAHLTSVFVPGHPFQLTEM